MAVHPACIYHYNNRDHDYDDGVVVREVMESNKGCSIGFFADSRNISIFFPMADSKICSHFLPPDCREHQVSSVMILICY